MNNYLTILCCASALMIFSLTGCGIVPLWVNVTHRVVDAALVVETGKTSWEHGLSEITGEDCRFIRALDGVDICMSDGEYLRYLDSLNCDIYAWGILNRVFCEKGT